MSHKKYGLSVTINRYNSKKQILIGYHYCPTTLHLKKGHKEPPLNPQGFLFKFWNEFCMFYFRKPFNDARIWPKYKRHWREAWKT